MKKRMIKKATSHFNFILNKNLPKSKRSQGHVEVIASFALFIGVLIFIFFIMNPFAKAQERTLFIDNVKRGFLQNVSDKTGKLSVIVETPGNCYNLDEVKKYGEYFVEVEEEPRKYTLYYNNFFGPAQTPSCDGEPEDYELGIYSEEQMLFYERIRELAIIYNTDDENYKKLKTSIRVSNDFSFSFNNLEGTEIPELSVSRNIPAGLDVESKEFPVRVIDRSGNIQELVLNLRSW